MFVQNGRRGLYRAVSITGDKCDLDCDHCRGSLLKTMPQARTPEALIRFGIAAEARGDLGMLVTGGCDGQGRLPWEDFLPAVRDLKDRTNLTITVHSGQVDRKTAVGLKEAGVDQALLDVIGDEATAKEVYHLPGGTADIVGTMESLSEAGLEIIPHILFGLNYGLEKGERHALRIIERFPVKKYIVVVLMPAGSTPMAHVRPPETRRVALFLARARLELPRLKAHLGCARPRGLYRRELDLLAIQAGVNSMALASDGALELARERGLEIVHRETCCSLG
jgi:uncharacterized radical SAM superfamily protein